MTKRVVLTGQTFGRLVVISFAGQDKHRNALWNCVCECGNEVVVPRGNLQSGNTTSCGCLHSERISETHTTHGLSGTPQYQAWKDARGRTTNPNHPLWKYYGGRGIEMCQEWRESPEAFHRDMDASWKEGLTLERKDTNGNYCPENCKWATEGEQQHNKRKKGGCSSQYKGVCFDKRSGKFLARITKNKKHNYLGYFTNELDAAIAHDNASEDFYGDRPNGTDRGNNGD